MLNPSKLLKLALAALIFSITTPAIAEDQPKLILLTVKGEGIDQAVKSNIRVAIEQALAVRYTVYSGAQVDDKIEREFIKQCQIYQDDADLANSECMKEVAGFFVADYIATPQISLQAGGYLLTLEIRDAYTSQSFDPYSDNCIDCSVLELADAFRAMIANKNRAAGLGAPVFIESIATGDGGSSSVVDLTAPVKPQDRGQLALLLFDSVPSGAEVWLGDIKAGTTPYQNLQLSSGQNLNITLKAQDYRDLQVALTLQPGSNTPKPFELIPAFGSLSITSEPSGADVYLSGELVGQTPYSSQRLASAKYLVDIRKPLYLPLSNQTIAIEDGQLAEHSYKLQPNFGDLSVASEPPAATITLETNGREVYRGSTPISLQLEPATYILSANKSGYAQRRFEVKIARGQSTSIGKEQLQLRQLLGTAIISSEPTSPGARVLIDGKDAGTIPLVTELPPGSYQVEIKADQLSGTAQLQVRYGEQQTLVVELESKTSLDVLQPSANVIDLTRPVEPEDKDQQAILILDSVPSGAEIWLGGIKAGTTPYQNLDLASGQSIDIALRTSGYHDLLVKLTLMPGRNAPKTFLLTSIDDETLATTSSKPKPISTEKVRPNIKTVSKSELIQFIGSTHSDYTKLDAQGYELPKSAQSWSCVLDNRSGLVWEVKTDDGGARDKDKRYRWGGKGVSDVALKWIKNSPVNKYPESRWSGKGKRYDDWDKLVDSANSERLCGFSDWRVPDLYQLTSLVRCRGGRVQNLKGCSGRYQRPTIDTDYFPNAQSHWFWSSSPDASSSYDAWSIYFKSGYNTRHPRHVNIYVRLVRSRP